MRRTVALTLFLGLTSCQSAPIDPYDRADGAVTSGQLLSALALLDQVPPAHPRYPEARTLAQAVERRMRAAHEMFLRGLQLRTEWRDEEAIRYFEWAREIWPSIEGADDLIAATRNRMDSLDQVGSSVLDPGSVASTSPVGILGIEPEEGELGQPPAVPGPEVVIPQPDMAPDEGLSSQLAAAEGLLALGELQEALARLEDLHILHPDALEVRHTLARVLHQRALVRYGQGYLEAAIADWARVRQLDEKLTRVNQFLDAARAELSERKR